MYSIKMMQQLRGGVSAFSRENKGLYSKILLRISPAGYTCVDDGYTKRNYSALTKCGTHHTLHMKQLQQTSCIMTDRRNLHLNVILSLIELLEGQFIFFHEMTGIPWWGTILACTLPIRMAISYKIYRYQVKMKYKNYEIKKRLLPKVMREESWKHSHLSKKDKKVIMREKEWEHQRRLNKEVGFNPYTGITMACLPLPYWIANSVALSHLCGARTLGVYDIGSSVQESMRHEGLFWFQDLCVADPYHILPVAIAINYLMSIELNRLIDINYDRTKNLTPAEKRQAVIKRIVFGAMTVWCAVSVFIFWTRPTAMVYYWFTSGLFSFIFRLVLLHPYFENRIVSEDVHVLQDQNAYETMYKNMKKRYRWFFKN